MQNPSPKKSVLSIEDARSNKEIQHESPSEDAAEQEDEKIYPSGLKLNLIVTGLTLSVLLVALVQLILMFPTCQ